MNTKKLLKASYLTGLAALMSLSTFQSAYAAPGTLATAPLFLSSIVEPNVFFTLDDSGSMDFELLMEDNVAGIDTYGGIPIIDYSWISYLHPTWNQRYTAYGYRALPPTNGTRVAWDEFWVFRNHEANKLYYNPNVRYTPWPGSDTSGNPLYGDADITAVMQDPNSTSSATTNLLLRYDFIDRYSNVYPGASYLPTYFDWVDSNGNGEVDQTDARTMVEIDPAATETVLIDGVTVNVMLILPTGFNTIALELTPLKRL